MSITLKLKLKVEKMMIFHFAFSFIRKKRAHMKCAILVRVLANRSLKPFLFHYSENKH